MLAVCIICTVLILFGSFACVLCLAGRDGGGFCCCFIATLALTFATTYAWVSYYNSKQENIQDCQLENPITVPKNNLYPKEVGYFTEDSTFVVVDTVYISK